MNEQNYNAIKGTPLEEILKRDYPEQRLGPSDREMEQEKRISELEEENAGLKQDLQDAKDRLEHVEPVFALAREMYRIPNPYSQGQKQTEIFEYFRRHKYSDWYTENGF